MKNRGTSKILIMCGGQGRRLGKTGEALPKSLIKIKDKPILEWKLHHYIKQGFKNFIMCIGYKGEMIKKAVKGFDFNADVSFSDGGEPAGILKRIYITRELFGKNAIVTYGDTYAEIDLHKLLEKHRASRDEATVVVAPIQSPFGLVDFDDNGKVRSFDEKPTLNYFIGYAVINNSALDFAPPKVIDMPNGAGLVAFYKILMTMGRLGVFYHPGFQITFNTEDELKIAKERMVSFYTTRERR